MVVVKLLAHSVGQLHIGRVYKWGMQSIVVESREFKYIDCIDFGIPLVGGMLIRIGLELLISDNPKSMRTNLESMHLTEVLLELIYLGSLLIT